MQGQRAPRSAGRSWSSASCRGVDPTPTSAQTRSARSTPAPSSVSGSSSSRLPSACSSLPAARSLTSRRRAQRHPTKTTGEEEETGRLQRRDENTPPNATAQQQELLYRRLQRLSLCPEEGRAAFRAQRKTRSSTRDASRILANPPAPPLRGPHGPEETTPPLRSLNLAGVAHHISRGRARRIIVMSGAGISVSAGIPDFRSPGTGLYYNLQQYNLPTPTAIFDLSYFQERPEPFFTLAKELYPGRFKPTVVHHFIRLLHLKGLLLRNYTQNIDALERLAGLPSEVLVEAHGSFYTAHCTNPACRHEYNHTQIKDMIYDGKIPRCKHCCGHLIKPDITFFGEPLPERFFRMVEQDFSQCDLLMVIGTSLQVRPFNELIDKVPASTPRVLINREEVGKKKIDLFGNRGGFRFGECDNTRDVQHLGDCDATVLLLAQLLGWDTELEHLYAQRTDTNTDATTEEMETAI